MSSVDPPGADHLSRRESDVVARRRRGRNLALLAALIGVVVLFYAITIAKLH
jgi:hypothetical protein